MSDRIKPSGESRYYSPVQEDHGSHHIKGVEALIPGTLYVLHQPVIRFEYNRFRGLEDDPREMVVIVPSGETSLIDPEGNVYAMLSTKPNSKKMVTHIVTPESMGMEPDQNGYLKGAWVELIPSE